MAELMAGGAAALDRRPIISVSACWTVSPLRYAGETVTILDETVRQRLPVVLSSAPQAGARSPAALAGTLVQITAEQLSGIVYVKLLNPGHPLLMGCVPAQADLRSGAFIGGSGEFALLNAACAQIAQHLGLPLYNSSGITDSKVPNTLAGAEKGPDRPGRGWRQLHPPFRRLSRIPAERSLRAVIDNEINGLVMRMLRGIEVSDESLSLDVIDEVRKGPGHFLGHAQTPALMNSEYLYPRLMNRESRDDREARCGAGRARQVLVEHGPAVIPSALDAELRRRFGHLAASERDAPSGLTGGWREPAAPIRHWTRPRCCANRHVRWTLLQLKRPPRPMACRCAAPSIPGWPMGCRSCRTAGRRARWCCSATPALTCGRPSLRRPSSRTAWPILSTAGARG
jgi:trimethylamine--corrinoid protein Co-methyltransferase